MANSLPKKLNKEPLIDAVFEIRFSSKIPATLILPGALFNTLGGEKLIEQLPIANIPKQVRDADPNLKFAPITRIDWAQFFINIGDSSLSISCKYPYCGWAAFKSAIIEITNILNQCALADTVERYAMKYVDIFPTKDYPQMFSMINASVSVADHVLANESFQLRIDINRDNLIHAVQLASSAIATLHNGKTIEGFILDVDTSSAQNNITMKTLLENFPDKLDSIHLANKTMFFDCLRQETINSLEPIYE